MDEWVGEERLDTRKVQYPTVKDGAATPSKKIATPSSPPTPSTSSTQGQDLINGSAVLAAALQKKISRKRKIPMPSSQPSSEPEVSYKYFFIY